MKKIKLAIVSPYPPSKGTLNEYAYHLVESFKNKESIEELIIITDTLPEGEEYPKFVGNAKLTIHQVWNFNSIWNVLKIRKALVTLKADLVLYNIQFLSFGDKKIPAALGLLTPLVSRLSGIPSVVLLHNIMETVDLKSAGITGNPILKWVYNFSGSLMTRILLQANMVTVTMAKYVQILEEKYKATNVALVPHGSFELPAIPDFEKEQDVDRIMTFGKFGTYKKVGNMIEAILKVRKKLNRRIEIVIAGTDNPNVKGYLGSIADQYKDVEDLKFTGYVAEEDVPDLFNNSTAVLFDYTSTTGSSGVLHQAGCFGKAVILPKIGDLKELVEEEGYVGEFFKPGDVNGMADCVERLLVDKERRIQLGQMNYTAAASLPLDDIAEWYGLHFENVLKDRRKPRVSVESQPLYNISLEM